MPARIGDAATPKVVRGAFGINNRRAGKARLGQGTGPACGAARGAVEGVMSRVALYPGSFDPVTNGHLDVVRQAVGLCDRLIVAIGVHPGKTPLFSAEERLEMVQEVFGPVAAKAGCAFDATTYDNLTVTAAQRTGATIMIRGLRDGTDLDYRDADRRHERNHGAGGADGFPAGLGRRSPDHRHTGAPNRRHGRRRLGVRAAGGRQPVSKPNSPASATSA